MLSIQQYEDDLADRFLRVETRLGAVERKNSKSEGGDWALPDSTFSLLISHDLISWPSFFAVCTITVSVACLVMVLITHLGSTGMPGNPLGMPTGVSGTVRAAQFIGALVGVIMEDEIPTGLQLIANGAGHVLLLNGNKPVQKKVMVTSILRLVVGYLFLASLFFVIARSAYVIQIFYDILALEFVENIDDISFALAKRGFFGKILMVSANRKHDLQIQPR